MKKFTDKEYAEMKDTKQECFDIIAHSNKRLELLREKCDHPETELCTYSTRPGQTFEDTEICSICGDVVRWPDWTYRSGHRDNMPEPSK